MYGALNPILNRDCPALFNPYTLMTRTMILFIRTSVLLAICATPLLTVAFASSDDSQNKLVLITKDGVRCQEMFDGFQPEIWSSQFPDEDIHKNELYQKYWAETGEERREKLWPFFWGNLIKGQGAIIGDRANDHTVKLSNQRRVSYPGYSEILTGRSNDEVIQGNQRIVNPNPTILEFLKAELNLQASQVACFAS